MVQGIYDRQRVRKEVEDMLADLQLVGKSKIQSARLSGGMKRKLRYGVSHACHMHIMYADMLQNMLLSHVTLVSHHSVT